jgi:ATP-binding cassette subfamily C protein/ATP-binding cassette subfamily C protein EexD
LNEMLRPMPLNPGMPDRMPETVLSQAVASSRGQLIAVGLFSGVVNMLQLTVSLYMMQVFDRVLGTRSIDTLYYLTLIACFALLVMAALDGLRSQIMQRIASWMRARRRRRPSSARSRASCAAAPTA